MMQVEPVPYAANLVADFRRWEKKGMGRPNYLMGLAHGGSYESDFSEYQIVDAINSAASLGQWWPLGNVQNKNWESEDV